MAQGSAVWRKNCGTRGSDKKDFSVERGSHLGAWRESERWLRRERRRIFALVSHNPELRDSG